MLFSRGPGGISRCTRLWASVLPCQLPPVPWPLATFGSPRLVALAPCSVPVPAPICTQPLSQGACGFSSFLTKTGVSCVWNPRRSTVTSSQTEHATQDPVLHLGSCSEILQIFLATGTESSKARRETAEERGLLEATGAAPPSSSSHPLHRS